MLVLDQHRADVVRSVCELIVPGCARTGPRSTSTRCWRGCPTTTRGGVLAAFDALEEPAAEGEQALGERSLTPEFLLVRALACEAFYSDFVAPGAPGPGAWDEIDFKPPLAARLDKDWSYLGVGG